MENLCNYETALALKQAGFPQPEPEAGQVWYNASRQAIIITHIGVYAVGYAVINGLWEVWTLQPEDAKTAILDCVFAPTAADIITEMGWRAFAERPVLSCLAIATDPNKAAGEWLQKKETP